MIRCLWLYRYSVNYNFDHWFHLSLVRHMKQLGYDVIAYGPEIEKEYNDLLLVKYSPNISWDNLLDIVKPDVAILNTRSRAFDYYSPFTGEMRGCWLPKGFESTRIPKVLIDEDSHYEKDDNWVFNSNFQLTLQRHRSQALRKWKVKTLWHPFSVNTDVFKPNPSIQKVHKICFAGSMTSPYSDRIKAIRALENRGLIDVFPTRVKVGQDYIRCLQQYDACLSGASDYDICAAKNLEIMACGSLLITNRFTGLNEMFNNGSECAIWDNLNQLVDLGVAIQNNQCSYLDSVTSSARSYVEKYHSDEVRTEQLMTILKEEL